jgi:hypothetical protein
MCETKVMPKKYLSWNIYKINVTFLCFLIVCAFFNNEWSYNAGTTVYNTVVPAKSTLSKKHYL